MSYQNILFEKNESIATVTINREKSLNALNTHTLKELGEVFDKIRDDEDITVVILTGKGRSFVAGADISEMQTKTPEEAKEFARIGMEVFRKIESSPKVVIAKVNGFALGGGCELASSCDIRIASEKALFGQPEVTLGITPGFGGTQRLQRLIGQGNAKYVIYSGISIKADEALRMGLVQKVVSAEELDEEVSKLASKIAKNSPVGVKLSKEAINTGAQTDIDTSMKIEENIFGLCFSTQDQKEGMRAFLNKEKANFRKK